MHTVKLLLRKFRALRISLSLKFIIGVTLALMIAMGISLYLLDKNLNRLVMEQVDMQAKALFSQIVITRKWIADHGGIFVEKLPWKEASPFLKEPEIIDVKGRKYVKESPAMVTKELSEYAKEEGAFWFSITSLKLINPENAPDDFEKTALKKFEAKEAEDYSRIEQIGDSSFYRYTAPLYVKKPCLVCHAHQGYTVGDVRGALSVSVPMDKAFSMIHSQRMGMITGSIATVGILVLILFVMMKELVLRPVRELKVSMNDLSGGEKSDATVIRTGDELEDLSDSFVRMSDSLVRYHARLENAVKKATGELEEANLKLTELNEKKSDFIAKISHELRTPMTSIKGAMDYISTKMSKVSGKEKDVDDIAEFLDVIRNNADRLIRLVNDTLNLERIESGVVDMNIRRIDLISLIKDVITGFQSMTGEKKISFRIVAASGIYAEADEDMIRQVLINLISNAINYSPDNGEIEIRLKREGGSVRVTVRDQGPGIPDEVSEKIFDKFYTIGKRHGTGLGLAICKSIIETHHGEIGVIRDIEKGSAIYFTLPKEGRKENEREDTRS